MKECITCGYKQSTNTRIKNLEIDNLRLLFNISLEDDYICEHCLTRSSDYHICADCGSALAHHRSDLFSVKDGGYCCSRHRTIHSLVDDFELQDFHQFCADDESSELQSNL